MVPINYLAVLGAAVVAIGLGFLWFGPLFGKQWMESIGITPDKMEAMKAAAKEKGMGKNYAIMTLSTLVMSYVLAHALIFASTYLNTTGTTAGLQTGFWNWLGFVVPVTLGSVLWDGKSWKYWFITAGYYLAALLLMGVVLALWV
ncbi:DUF1761 domain-containing protein [Candidatus Kaiserbacteria bacterium]|nr:DUF1761 domain-containing protein [Candidatus Kaiserbacteria bacterium]